MYNGIRSAMDMTEQTAHPGDRQAFSIQDGVNLLFEELTLAMQWKRPSILLVVYDAEPTRVQAELLLENDLVRIRKQAIPFEVDEASFDIPLILSRNPARKKTVYFVSGLRRGGGREGKNAYRALNMRRELFVDRGVRLILWLTAEEAVDLSRYAPDFWAFRHRAIEISGIPRAEQIAALSEELPEWEELGRVKNSETQIAMRESLLVHLPDQEETLPTRLNLLLTLAGLYWARGKHQRSIQLLKQSKPLAQRLQNTKIMARYWGYLGLTLDSTEHPKSALSAYQKACQLEASDAGLWSGLGELYLKNGQPEEAVHAFQRACELAPRQARPWRGLGKAHQSLGEKEEALPALLKAARLNPRHAGVWADLETLYLDLGDPQKALQASQKAGRLLRKTQLPGAL